MKTKLSKTQQELYDAMKSGTSVYYMRFMGRFNPNPYYFRGDILKHCTAAARALEDKGLVERYDNDGVGHKLRAKL